LFEKESITPEAKTMRLDTWVHHQWPWIPYGSIQKAIRRGEIRLDQSKVSPKERLSAYTNVWYKPRWLSLFEQPSPAKALNTTWQNRVDQWVLYEDAHLIAFNKPQGSHPKGDQGKNYTWTIWSNPGAPNPPFAWCTAWTFKPAVCC
jgi:23S rRNA pseudouridine955/2504/2580 synthase